MVNLIGLLLAFFVIGTLVGSLFLWRKIAYSYFRCSKCQHSYRPTPYKPIAGGFGLQAFFPFFGKLFILLPIFFGGIFYRCPNCKEVTWHILQQPRKGILLGGIGLVLGLIIFVGLTVLIFLSPSF